MHAFIFVKLGVIAINVTKHISQHLFLLHFGFPFLSLCYDVYLSLCNTMFPNIEILTLPFLTM